MTADARRTEPPIVRSGPPLATSHFPPSGRAAAGPPLVPYCPPLSRGVSGGGGADGRAGGTPWTGARGGRTSLFVADARTDVLPGRAGERYLRSKFGRFASFCNSRKLSRFAAFVLGGGPEVSIAVGCVGWRAPPRRRRLGRREGNARRVGADDPRRGSVGWGDGRTGGRTARTPAPPPVLPGGASRRPRRAVAVPPGLPVAREGVRGGRGGTARRREGGRSAAAARVACAS